MAEHTAYTSTQQALLRRAAAEIGESMLKAHVAEQQWTEAHRDLVRLAPYNDIAAQYSGRIGSPAVTA